MIKINIELLKTELEQLNNVLVNYETTELNLFNQLKNATSSDWNDNRSEVFADAIDIEKKESQEIVDSFNDVADCLKYIIDKYESIGNRISVNLEKKTDIINAYGKIENKINTIVSYLNSVDKSFSYSEKSSINDMRDSFNNLKRDVSDSRDKVKELFKKIERIENDIAKKVRDLKAIKIEDFDYVLDY